MSDLLAPGDRGPINQAQAFSLAPQSPPDFDFFPSLEGNCIAY